MYVISLSETIHASHFLKFTAHSLITGGKRIQLFIVHCAVSLFQAESWLQKKNQFIPHFLTTLSLAEGIARDCSLDFPSDGGFSAEDLPANKSAADVKKFRLPRKTYSKELKTIANITLPLAIIRYWKKGSTNVNYVTMDDKAIQLPVHKHS